MSCENIRIGIVGAGTNTVSKHLPGLQAIDGVEVVSVCNRSRLSSQRVADRFGIPTVYDKWPDLVSAPDTDAIVIGTWPYLHCQATLASLDAGKHVMVEARMAMNLDEAQQMLAKAQTQPNLVAQIVPSPFSFGVDATIKRLINEGFLGDVLAIEVRDHGGAFLDRNSPLTWRQDADLSGLNVMSLGIWYETLMRWVGEASAVMAMGKIFVKTRREEETGNTKAVRIPDHLAVLAVMVNGAQATFSISSVTGLSSIQEAVLYGSDGTMRFADGKLFGGRRGDEMLSQIAIPVEEQGSWRVEEEFVGAIRGTETIQHTTFETGVNYMRFTEAVARSRRSGESVTLL